MSFENVFSYFFSKMHLMRGIPIVALVWKNLLSQVSKQKQTRIGCFSFEYQTECSSILKRKSQT